MYNFNYHFIALQIAVVINYKNEVTLSYHSGQMFPEYSIVQLISVIGLWFMFLFARETQIKVRTHINDLHVEHLTKVYYFLLSESSYIIPSNLNSNLLYIFGQ